MPCHYRLHLKSLGLIALLTVLASCTPEDDTVTYEDWRLQNQQYMTERAAETLSDGTPRYRRISPQWCPGAYTLMEWHNDTDPSPDALTPLDNSTVICNYTLTDIEGNTLDRGAGYKTQPCRNVVGFWNALTSMQPGDTVTAIVPYEAGYGSLSNGAVKPYSTLIFNIRLKEISGYEIKH